MTTNPFPNPALQQQKGQQRKREKLDVHGWIYGLDNGRLHDLGFVARHPDDVRPGYDRAVGKLLK